MGTEDEKATPWTIGPGHCPDRFFEEYDTRAEAIAAAREEYDYESRGFSIGRVIKTSDADFWEIVGARVGDALEQMDEWLVDANQIDPDNPWLCDENNSDDSKPCVVEQLTQILRQHYDRPSWWAVTEIEYFAEIEEGGSDARE